MKIAVRKIALFILLASLLFPYNLFAGQANFNITTEDANTGVTFRAAINAALQALASNNLGPAAPAVTYPGQIWIDSTNHKLKVRSEDNTAWTILMDLTTGHVPYSDASAVGVAAALSAAYIDWTASSGGPMIKNKPTINGRLIGEVVDWEGPVIPSLFLWCDGSSYDTTTYLSLFSALTVSTSGVFTSSSPVVTNIATTAAMRAGKPVYGSSIPAGTVITTVDSLTQITMSQNATVGGTAAFVYAPHGAGSSWDITNNRPTTFNVPDRRGKMPIGAGQATPPIWAKSTAYAQNYYVTPTASYNYTYEATGAGTTGSTEPTWPTSIGSTVSDGGVTWTCRAKWSSRALGETGGAEAHSMTIAEMAAHSHTGTLTGGGQVLFSPSDWWDYPHSLADGAGLQLATGSITISTTGSGTAHSLMNPYAATNFIIFAGQ